MLEMLPVNQESKLIGLEKLVVQSGIILEVLYCKEKKY